MKKGSLFFVPLFTIFAVALLVPEVEGQLLCFLLLTLIKSPLDCRLRLITNEYIYINKFGIPFFVIKYG